MGEPMYGAANEPGDPERSHHFGRKRRPEDQRHFPIVARRKVNDQDPPSDTLRFSGAGTVCRRLLLDRRGVHGRARVRLLLARVLV